VLRQLGADRLDSPTQPRRLAVAVLVDETRHHGSRGSSSRAKKLDAANKISFARFSSFTSCCNSWLDEAAADKEHAELALAAAMQLQRPTLSIEEIVAVVEHYGGLNGILHQATREERAALYEAIGVSAVYNPQLNQVRLGADPVPSTACRRSALDPNYTTRSSIEVRRHTLSRVGLTFVLSARPCLIVSCFDRPVRRRVGVRR
jgi:hypothetical protein